MQNFVSATVLLIAGLVAGAPPVRAAGPDASSHELGLSPGVLGLLRAEMLEIASGVQGMALSLATADWQAIAQTGERIRASYVMEKSLTAAQAEELERKLPARFRQLDAEFHRRAEKLTAAARAADAELVVYHYSRLMEGCIECHTAYATTRFPAFSPAPPREHRH